jgi:carboxymethylenebutenolidase
MKTILLLVLTYMLYVVTPLEKEPAAPALCHQEPLAAAHDMAAMAADPAFQGLHEQPISFHYQGPGEMITFPTSDGKKASGFFLKSTQPSDKWLLVYQEWWGLNDHIKQQALQLHKDLPGVNVLALDMYDGQVATTREDAAKLMQSASADRLAAITQGGITFAGKKAKIASIGWCFGGMLSLQNALAAGDKTVGCVIYYGRPEEDVAKLKTLKTDVLGIFGSQDQGITPAMVAKFEQNMKAAGKQVTIKMYDAVHGFANPSNPKHDPAATVDAYTLTLNYLKKKLG